MGLLMYIILGVATGTKVLLLIYCYALQSRSESMLALAEDHRNDIISNLGAIACGAAASALDSLWWIDPVGAIVISLYIIWSWARILWGQVSRLFEPALINSLDCIPPTWG
jgi:divalent metal cation (Fe/Co/Zn/Cd) transporter